MTTPISFATDLRLYRFFVTSDDGDYTRTLALVWARNDEEAMTAGWDAVGIEAQVEIEERCQRLGVSVSCEDLCEESDPFLVEERVENALLDIPALASLFPAELRPSTRERLQRRLISAITNAAITR